MFFSVVYKAVIWCPPFIQQKTTKGREGGLVIWISQNQCGRKEEKRLCVAIIKHLRLCNIK
jgi:hypothetical protein